MADEIDVANAFGAMLEGIVYPGGLAAASAIVAPVEIYRGYPEQEELDPDLAAGKVHVSIFPMNGVESTKAVYPRDAREIGPRSTPLTWSAVGQVATLAGVPALGLAIGFAPANGSPVGYVLTSADTLATACAALAAKIAGAASSGATVTLPAAASGSFVASTSGTTATELRRHTKQFVITCWAPSNDLREAVARLFDVPFADICWLRLADGTAGKVDLFSTFEVDNEIKDGCWRRDWRFAVEYPTVALQTTSTIAIVSASLSTPGQ